MLCGIMDHWVPSADAVSRFWKTPFETLAPLMTSLCDEVAVNNVTFYTKWYTNGYRSNLPFLPNHPEAQNVRTGNDWGRQWIDFLHARGMTAGAMIQSYTYMPGYFPEEHTLGVWKNTSDCTGLPPEKCSIIIDPTYPAFTAAFEAMLEEQLRLFPGLDAVFLEFEGLCSVAPVHALARAGAQATPDESIRAQWNDCGWSVPERDWWIWTPPVQSILKERLRAHLSAAERVFARVGFRGVRGVVYHAMSYETPYLTGCLPSKDWWLLPWHYWGWDFDEQTPDAMVRRQMDWCKAQFRARIAEGHPLCYIGNATLPTQRLDSIREMANFCKEEGAAGHLGMGNPIPDYGLRWLKATEGGIRTVRALYRELFPK